MKKIEAFLADHDHRQLFHTERQAREAEFDALFTGIAGQIGSRDAAAIKGSMELLATQLRSGVYPSAGTLFLKAADYFREHRDVLTGKVSSSETPT